MGTSLEGAAFWRLWELAVCKRRHLPAAGVRTRLQAEERHAPANLYKHRLEAAVPVPMREDGQLRRIDLPVDLIDKR